MPGSWSWRWRCGPRNWPEAYRGIVYRLAKAGEYRDSDTGHHVARVSRYAEIVAARLGLDEELVGRISQAASLHDIGKVGIRDAILFKPGPLTAEEYREMQQHCELGEAICSSNLGDLYVAPSPQQAAGVLAAGPVNSPVLELAAIIAKSHHEKWDGTGYPCQLAGEAIPLEGRIVAAVDVFDALTSRRPYKPAYSIEKSLAIMEQEREKHFEPRVLDAFLAEVDAIRQVYYELSDLPPEVRADGDSTVVGGV